MIRIGTTQNPILIIKALAVLARVWGALEIRLLGFRHLQFQDFLDKHSGAKFLRDVSTQQHRGIDVQPGQAPESEPA